MFIELERKNFTHVRDGVCPRSCLCIDPFKLWEGVMTINADSTRLAGQGGASHDAKVHYVYVLQRRSSREGFGLSGLLGMMCKVYHGACNLNQFSMRREECGNWLHERAVVLLMDRYSFRVILLQVLVHVFTYRSMAVYEIIQSHTCQLLHVASRPIVIS